MPRPNHAPQRRNELIPSIARAFAELGYRRTTTAELARRCGAQETILYRLWPDKKAMFLAAIGTVYGRSVEIWDGLLKPAAGSKTTAEQVLDHEAQHHGEFGLYRIVFAGLSEADDPDIRATLRDMYARFHRFIRDQIRAHRGDRDGDRRPAADMAAWALIGLGTVASISREMQLLPDRRRRRLIRETGRLLLEGRDG